MSDEDLGSDKTTGLRQKSEYLNTRNYALQTPEFAGVVQMYAPDMLPRVKTSVIPEVSGYPDDLEKWEAEQIDVRKQKMAFETDFSWALRVLYEETFSVNQNPEETKDFKGSNGLTTGGLISHFHPWSISDGVGLLTARELDLQNDTLKEQLLKTGDLKERDKTLQLAEMITYPSSNFALSRMKLEGPRRAKALQDPEAHIFNEDLDTYGYRFMKLINLLPELTEMVQDPKLKEMCGIRVEAPIMRVDFVRIMWKKFSTGLITERGTYKTEGEAGVIRNFQDLLFVRTHPEMQFLYKFKSPSGYINDIK